MAGGVARRAGVAFDEATASVAVSPVEKVRREKLLCPLNPDSMRRRLMAESLAFPFTSRVAWSYYSGSR